MTYARIEGTGRYLPKKILTNDELSKQLETSDEWIVSRTGIKQRHIADRSETTSSMAVVAAKRALESASIKADELDMILVATCTPDRMFPSTACLVQEALGVHRIPSFDVSAACAGFMFGLSIAEQYIKTGTARCILLIGSEVMSRVLDWNDRRTCVLFGDGAGAVVLKASDQRGIHSTHIHAEGAHQQLLYLPNEAVAPEKEKQNSRYLQMEGREVFKVAVKEMGDSVDETLQANHMEHHHLDWLVPHQANIRIIQAMAKKCGLPMEKVMLTVDQHANTSAASIPLALDQGIKEDRIQRGQTLLLEGFGGGMAWGSALITY